MTRPGTVRTPPSRVYLPERMLFSGGRGQVTALMVAGLELPDGNDRHHLGEEHVQERHRRKRRARDDDLNRLRPVDAVAVRQILVPERRYDDEKPLEPHADDHADRRQYTAGHRAEISDA